VGTVAQTIGEVLGTTWTCCATREPLLDRWDITALTQVVQRSMPESQAMRAAGTHGSFAQVQVGRTKAGLLEHTVGGVPLAEGRDPWELATDLAERVVGSHAPTIGFVSLAEYDEAVPGDVSQGLVQAARPHASQAPLVVVIGPKAVRDLKVDVGALAGEHDVRPLGRAKTPCVLVRFTGEHPERRWGQLNQFAATLGAGNIARALGRDV
jgi:hypothetical protein